MDPNDQLRKVTIRAQQENDLPDSLAERLFAIAERSNQGQAAQLQQLIEQVELYDTFAQTGYIGMGVDHVVLSATLDRLEQQLDQDGA